MNIDGHECYLLDDGTLDTVIQVDGIEFRFSDTLDMRDDNGDLTEKGFITLCEDCIDDLWQYQL